MDRALKLLAVWLLSSVVAAGAVAGAWFIAPVALTLYIGIPVAFAFTIGMVALAALFSSNKSKKVQPRPGPFPPKPKPAPDVSDDTADYPTGPSLSDSFEMKTSQTPEQVFGEMQECCEDIDMYPFHEYEDVATLATIARTPYTLSTGHSYSDFTPLKKTALIQFHNVPSSFSRDKLQLTTRDIGKLNEFSYRLTRRLYYSNVDGQYYAANEDDLKLYQSDTFLHHHDGNYHLFRGIAQTVDKAPGGRGGCHEKCLEMMLYTLPSWLKLEPNLLQVEYKGDGTIEYRMVQSYYCDAKDVDTVYAASDEFFQLYQGGYVHHNDDNHAMFNGVFDTLEHNRRANPFLANLSKLICDKKPEDLPHARIRALLRCPLTGLVITNPVLLSDGRTIQVPDHIWNMKSDDGNGSSNKSLPASMRILTQAGYSTHISLAGAYRDVSSRSIINKYREYLYASRKRSEAENAKQELPASSSEEHDLSLSADATRNQPRIDFGRSDKSASSDDIFSDANKSDDHSTSSQTGPDFSTVETSESKFAARGSFEIVDETSSSHSAGEARASKASSLSDDGNMAHPSVKVVEVTKPSVTDISIADASGDDSSENDIASDCLSNTDRFPFTATRHTDFFNDLRQPSSAAHDHSRVLASNGGLFRAPKADTGARGTAQASHRSEDRDLDSLLPSL